MRKYSLVDAVFLLVFVALLFIPMSHISKADRSAQENRMLVTKPSLVLDNKINEKYGTEFDAWFNDHFYGRDIIIRNFSKIKYILSDIYQNDEALLVKSNGWMFNKSEFGYPENAEKLIESLEKFAKFCEQQNIKFYAIIVPEKEVVYSKILDKKYGTNRKNIDGFHKFVMEIQNAVPNNIVIYPYSELMNASNTDFTFFKQSHHWTDFGAYTGYKALADRIKQDLPQFDIVSLDEYNQTFSNKIRDDWGRNFNTGHTTRLLNLLNRWQDFLDTRYTYYDNKTAKNVLFLPQNNTKFFRNNNKNKNYKLFLFGDSQNENLLQFLPYSVKFLKYTRLNYKRQSDDEQYKFMKYYAQDLLNYKPDIVVLCIKTSHLVDLLKNFYEG